VGSVAALDPDGVVDAADVEGEEVPESVDGGDAAASVTVGAGARDDVCGRDWDRVRVVRRAKSRARLRVRPRVRTVGCWRPAARVGTRFVAEPPKAAFDINVGYGGALLCPATR
jgi:hypothetical protein